MKDILSGSATLSEANIKKYEKYKKDLASLKEYVKKHAPEKYKTIFTSKTTKSNYYAYTKEIRSLEGDRDNFYAFLKSNLQLQKSDNNEGKDIIEVLENPELNYILEEIENQNFLPKQVSKDNGAIPYQIHLKEFISIVDNQSNFYPVLAEVKDKLIKTLTFRVPYYVGPLNPLPEGEKDNHPFAWSVRKEAGEVFPWNYEEKIDLIASAEKFIRRMTNMCSYLLDEPVIAKKSLLYSKYEVLNELNKIRVNGKLLDYQTKTQIINDVFLKYKKVNTNHIRKFFVDAQIFATNADIKIEGTQKEDEFASSLEPWIDFKKIYGEEFKSSFEDIEKIIEWISVYEDKSILIKRLKLDFPKYEVERVKAITAKRYSGWGRLSKKLLSGLKISKDDRFLSIMDILEETDLNFMQIINDKKLGFDKLIANASMSDAGESITYSHVSALQGSPALKKGIWHSIKIIKEIVHIMGCEPENIFIEFARSDDEKKRTVSRVDKLLKTFSDVDKDNPFKRDSYELYDNLKKNKKEIDLSNERLFLYYIQHGKCMYSGRPLDIDKLSQYQVDHIVPQSYVKDDSIENKVLVYSIENQMKGDKLFLNESVISKQYGFWKYLLDKKFITSKKFFNLTRSNSSISEKDEIRFINRQLVETRQITKHVTTLLSDHYKNTQVIAIKAALSHSFRIKNSLYKIREMNDYHHAHDAYFVSIIGLFILKRFPYLKKEFVFTEYKQMNNYRSDMKKSLDSKSNYEFIISSMNNNDIISSTTGELIWEGSKILDHCHKLLTYKDCFVTKKPEEDNGQLFNLTIEKKGFFNNTNFLRGIPVNKNRNDVLKYGGFSGVNKSFCIAVQYQQKDKTLRRLIDVPIYLATCDEHTLENYIKIQTGAHSVLIIKKKILHNQIIENREGVFYLASASEWTRAIQVVYSKESQEFIYKQIINKTNDLNLEKSINFYDEHI